MRILFVTSKIDFKSAGGSVPDLDLKVRKLTAMGHHVRVLTVYSSRNDFGSTPPPYEVIPEQVPRDTRVLPLITIVRDLLRKYESEVDLFHVEGQFGYGSGYYRKTGGKKPIVIFFNREAVAWTTPQGFVAGLKHQLRTSFEQTVGAHLMNLNDRFVFTNPRLKDAYQAFGFLSPAIVLGDFVDQKEMRGKIGLAAPDVDRHRRHTGPLSFIASGRMIPEKGFEEVVRGLAQLPKHIEWNATLSGDGPERERLIALTAELGIHERVAFPGWIDKQELLKKLSHADLFLLPRWHFALTSVILLESMAFATPVVVPKDTGLAWVAGAGGYTFTEGSISELAAGITYLSENGEARATLAAGCLTRLSELDPETMAKDLEAWMLEAVTETQST